MLLGALKPARPITSHWLWWGVRRLSLYRPTRRTLPTAIRPDQGRRGGWLIPDENAGSYCPL